MDDGSTDGSGEILDEYREKVEKLDGVGQRIVVIHQKNAGVSAARNAALDVARGEWVMFLDADDFLRDVALARIYKVLAAHPNEKLLRFNFAETNEFCLSRLSETCALRDIKFEVDGETYYSFLWQFAFKRELLTALKFPAYRRGEDRVFLIEVLCNRVQSFLEIGDALYFYRQRPCSAMQSVPNIQVLCDEMDHRLDVAEIFDRCTKKINYAGSDWLERYFTYTMPMLINMRDPEFFELRKLWRIRLRRALNVKGFSAEAYRYFARHTNVFMRWSADFRTFHMIRQRSFLCRAYRWFRHRGEFAYG